MSEYERGWNAAIEAAAQACEARVEDGYRYGNREAEQCAIAIRSLRPSPEQGAASESPLAALVVDNLCWRIMGEWYYECSAERIKQESVSPTNENAKSIRDEFAELKRILEAALAATGGVK